MRIVRLAINAGEYEKLHEYMKESLEQLGLNNIGKAKNEIRNAIKKLEELRPDLKNKGIR